MTITRRDLIKLAGATAALQLFPALVRAQGLEKKKVSIAVGGKNLFYYLPLTIAEQRGYFKDEGLDVEISDFAGGSRALQAVVGGSADICSGAFEHTISLQNKGQAFRAFALQGRAPQIVLAVSTKTFGDYKTPADLKGKKIGVSAPGSSTNMMVNFFLAKHGLKASDVSIIGVGTGAGAVAAMRSGQIDAMSNLDPVITTLERAGDIRIISDTRSLKDTEAVFGGPMPAACMYTAQAYIDKNPNTVQAVTNAIVRADKWLQTAGPSEIVKTVPEAFLMGDRALYIDSFQKGKEAISPDGMIPEAGAATALRALAAYDTAIDAKKIDLARIYTNEFVKKANQKYPNG